MLVIILDNLEKGNIEIQQVGKEIKKETDIDIGCLMLTDIK